MGVSAASSRFGALWPRCGRAALGLALAAASAAAAETIPDGEADASPYEVAAGCPTRQLWVERVVARVSDDPGTHAALQRLPVHIEAEPGGYRGWVGAAASEPDERRVRGRACGEVFDALVLIAALSLEADAGSPAAGVESLASIVVPAELAEPAAVPEDQGPDADARARPDTSTLRLGALGFAQVQSGVVPSLGTDVGAALVASWRSLRFDPWLVLGAYAGLSPQVLRVEGATARFEHWAVRAEGCPWRFPRDGLLALRPCVGVDVGRSRGEGAGVARASARSAPWLSGLAELRLDVTLAEHLALGVAGGATLPFVRPRYYFEPGVVAYHASSIGFAASSFAALLF
jgi:hypothetical protein